MHFTNDGGPLLAGADVDAESGAGSLQMTSPVSSFHSLGVNLHHGARMQPSRHGRFVDDSEFHASFAVQSGGSEGGRRSGARPGGDAGQGGQGLLPSNSFNDTFERVDGIAATPLEGLVVALEALRSVLGDVIDENVQYALWWAGWFFAEGEENVRNPYGLTVDEVAAILMYTMEFRPSSLYTELNRALRSASRATKMQPFFMYMRLFLTALYKLPTRKVTLYRGMRTTIEAVGYQSDSRTILWGFTSATPSPRVLESPQFLGTSGSRILFHITARCVDISPYSEFGERENERLIEAGTAFTIGDILHLGNGLCQVKMEEDPDAQSPFDFGPPADRICEEEAEVEGVRRELRTNKTRLAKYGCAFAMENLLLLLIGLVFGIVFFSRPVAGDSWHEMAHLAFPVSDAGPTAPVLNNSIFVVGGYWIRPRKDTDEIVPTDNVQVFDGSAWTISQHKLLVRLAGHAAVEYKGTVYVTGGISSVIGGNGVTRNVQALGSSGWSFAAPMATARSGHCASVFRGELFALGGDEEGNSVEAFDGSQWRSSVPMLQRRMQGFATVVCNLRRSPLEANQELLYALGGYGTSTVESFDGTSWRKEAPMKLIAQQEGINAVAFDGKIYVFGATVIQTGALNGDGRVTWRVRAEAASFWVPGQMYMAGCVFRDKYWAMGGGDVHSDPSNKTWSFDLGSLPN